MSFQYDQYLTQHRSNVKRGFDWIAENLPELLVDGFDYGWQIEFAHDKSKDEQDEYEAYDAYFYGGRAKSTALLRQHISQSSLPASRMQIQPFRMMA